VSGEPQPKPWPTLYAGVWALSVGVLLLEVSLTRVLSALTWYHFAFLVISSALLGFGASGLFVYLLPRRRSEAALRWQLGLSGLAFAASVFLVLPALEGYDPDLVRLPVSEMVKILGVAHLAAAAPFFFAGLCLALVFATFPRHSGALYGSDLVGAAMGCGLAIGALGRLGGVGAVVSSAAFAGLAVVFFGWGRRRVALPAMGGVGMLAAVIVAPLASKLVPLPLVTPGEVEVDAWNSFSRITVQSGLSPAFAWGASPRFPTYPREMKVIAIDGKAWTVIERFDGDPSKVEYLKWDVTAFPYWLRTGGTAGIIGPGGGRDVLTALVSGEHDMVGVEVNPLIVGLVRGKYADYAGHLYQRPGVRIVVDDARSFFERSKERFDIIQASLVDTWAASSSAAFALTENNLYTVQAFRAYIRHLTPEGILSVSRWHPPQGPRESLRLFALGLQALREQGVTNAEKNVVVIASPATTATMTGGVPAATMMLKPSPFSETELRTVMEKAQELGFVSVYVPGGVAEPLFAQVAGMGNLYRGCADIHGLDYRPPRDDCPFFFLFARLRALFRPVGQTLWENVEVRPLRLLVGLLLVVAVLVTLFIVAPLAAFARRPWAHAARSSHLLLYFAAIGVGFMMVEMSLMQRFILLLGHPVYSLSVILFSLLGFGGIGSLLTNRVGEEGARRRAGLALGGATALLVVYLVVLPLAVGRALGLGTGLRVGIAVGLLCPLALLIGMPLPLGMKLASRRDPNLIPWLWGINGAASVLGSVLAVVVAVAAGFTASLSVGAACYLAAALLVATSAPAPVTVPPGAPPGRADRPRPAKSAKKTRKR